MSRICELTGKGRLVGNNVSHANNKTKRTFLQSAERRSSQTRWARASAAGLDEQPALSQHVGGLDNWLAKTSGKLSLRSAAWARDRPEAAGGRRGVRLIVIDRREFQQQGHGAVEIVVGREPTMVRPPSTVTASASIVDREAAPDQVAIVPSADAGDTSRADQPSEQADRRLRIKSRHQAAASVTRKPMGRRW